MSFHPEGVGHHTTAAQNRAEKGGRGLRRPRVRWPACVGWCQFGPPDELPRIKNRRANDEGATALPDWRITCFSVDRACRGRGVTAAALAGALDEIARLGGGTVESYPEDVSDRAVAPSFLHNSTVTLFERLVFERKGRIGNHRWVVSIDVRSPRSTMRN